MSILGIDNNLLYLIGLAIVEIFGDFTLEKYTQTWDVSYLVEGSTWYVGVVFFLIKSLVGSNILYVNGMWDGISGLLESLAAFYFLGERFESTWQYLGLGMIISGLVLLKTK